MPGAWCLSPGAWAAPVWGPELESWPKGPRPLERGTQGHLPPFLPAPMWCVCNMTFQNETKTQGVVGSPFMR